VYLFVLPTNVKLGVWTLHNVDNYTQSKITWTVKSYSIVQLQVVSGT
jgi:hypothetical protein